MSGRLLLSLETTCDETGAAVLQAPVAARGAVPRVLSNVVASQHLLHARFGGVVPEIAARAHLRHILPVIDEALMRAGVALNQIEAVAVATRPGLVGSLIVGLSAAKGLALSLGVPLVAFDHLEGHLYACQTAHPEVDVYPCVGLVVSGGHTHLYQCDGPLSARLLGGTLDDAAGEAFDKVASLLKLSYPGGPAIEQAARSGNPRAFPMPRALMHDARLAFSFSGLKTAVLYTLRDQLRCREIEHPDPALVADLAASFQAAVVDVLIAKCRQALDMTSLPRLCVGGGVTANTVFRTRLAELASETGCRVYVPPAELCTDNAALGAIAFAKLDAGLAATLDCDVQSGLIRGR